MIEYWVRVTSVWVILIAVALLLGAILLFPVYVLVSSQVDAKESAVTEASLKVNNFQEVSQSLEEASQLAKYALRESTLANMSDYLTLFESLQGPTITISSVEIIRQERGILPVLVLGVARDRRGLAEFRDRLLAEPNVVSVDLPISNLASDRDIKFTITVTVSNETTL